jgi:3-oxoacyl-[acyl-carrier-protein] synthase II
VTTPRQVVVTGIGPILPGCDARETMWCHLRDGASQLAFEHDVVAPGDRIAVGRIAAFDPAHYLGEFPARFYAAYTREVQIYLASVLRARDDARLDVGALDLDRTGLFDGSARPTFAFWFDRLRSDPGTAWSSFTRRDLLTGVPGQTVGIAASLLGVRGPAYAFTCTCASGAVSIGHAYREIERGDIDVAFATGHDCPLLPPMFAMYREANLLSREAEDARRAVRAYVGHSTNAFGEGAVTLVLEERGHAEARGAPILAEIAGYAYGNNGYHPTAVDITGLRPAQILGRLLERAGVPLADVGYVVGHGNAVQLSDVSEENYMRMLFGPRASEIPLISTKPIYGHTLGASSSISVSAAALMLRHEHVVPTINIDVGRTKRNTNHQPNQGRPGRLEAGLAVSYGLGGHNAALLLKRWER